MELGIHSLEIQLIGKIDGAVDPFVRDTTDWKMDGAGDTFVNDTTD